MAANEAELRNQLDEVTNEYEHKLQELRDDHAEELSQKVAKIKELLTLNAETERKLEE